MTLLGRLLRSRAAAVLVAAAALPFFAGAQPAASGTNICAWDFLRPSLQEGAGPGGTLSAVEAERTLVENLELLCTSLVVEDLPTALADDCVLTAAAGALVCGAGAGGSPLTVREEDGAPSVAGVAEIRVTNGTLTDNTGGSVSITTGGGGGGSSNSFETITPSSGTAPAADSATDTLAVTGTGPITVTGDSAADSLTMALTQHAGTDVTADLEEEAHAAEHHEGGGDAISADALASACDAGETLEGDGAGGVQCGIDDGGAASDHGLLSGLADDDHPQYTLLAGRAGGQTILQGLTVEGGFTVNDLGGDFDFRVEGDTEPNLILADASTDRVGIGTGSPQHTLHVVGSNAMLQRTGGPAGVIVDRTDGGAGALVAGATHMTLRFAAVANLEMQSQAAENIRAGNGLGVVTPFKIEGTAPANSLSVGPSGLALFGTGSFGSGVGVISLANASTIPTTQVIGGGVLYVDGTDSSKLKWRRPSGSVDVVGSGGGGSSDSPYTGTYHPDRPPTSGIATASSDEFNGGISASWVWGNQGAATDTAEMDTALLTMTGADINEHARWLATPASGDFLVAAKVSLLWGAASDACGLVLLTEGTIATPTDQEALFIQATTTSASLISLNSFDGYDFGGNVVHNSVVTSAVYPPHQKRGFELCFAMRVTDASPDTVEAWWSEDCMTWQRVAASAVAIDGYPSHVGRYVRDEATCRWKWFRTITDATKIARLEVGQ